MGEWVDALTAAQEWRFSNCYESFKWHRDSAYLAVEKVAPNRYRIDASLLRFAHEVELSLGHAWRVEADAFVVALG